MNELVYLKNDEAVCSSLQVAEKFGKRHTHVIERIEKIIENDSTENSAQCFKASIYKDSTGKSNKMYVMNRDGFTFLVMGFTNDHHVAIDISVQDGRVMISEPYAVKEDLTAITDEEAAV